MNSTLQLAHDEAEKYQLDVEFVQDPALPSFEIRRVAGRLVVAAPTPLEMLYGVYECAERFGGYTFFEPGRDRFDAARRVLVCDPNLPDETLVPARQPRLKRRGFIQEFPFNTETPALFDWMAKNKLNYLLVWMKYYDELSEELKQGAVMRGIEIESGHHNFNYWIPGKVYGKTHQEFFAEINGRRISPQRKRRNAPERATLYHEPRTARRDRPPDAGVLRCAPRGQDHLARAQRRLRMVRM